MKLIVKNLINILYKCKDRFLRGIETISYEEAIELYDKGLAVIIDVREQEEYEEGHIQSSVNIPLYEISKKILNVVKNKEKIVILYCSKGKRSRLAKKMLEKEGYKNTYILDI